MRKQLHSNLTTFLALSGVFMAWKFISLITGSSVPVVVVISESMAPAFHRGDLLLLWNQQTAIEVGDVPVVWFASQPLPMVHRAVYSHWEPADSFGHTKQHIVTKGDNNDVDDVALYPLGRQTVLREEVKGVVRGYVPYLGWAAIAPQDFVHWLQRSLHQTVWQRKNSK